LVFAKKRTISASKPMLATFKKKKSSEEPTSKALVDLLLTIDKAENKSLGRFKARERSLPLPKGRMPKGVEEPIKAEATSRTVPSPPAAIIPS